ncbi:MAG: HD domain-containing protein [Promethearchaeota archaeon]
MKQTHAHKLLKINDPIHGFIKFPDFIRRIVDSKEIQRLMRIRQLSGTNHVFPGANHTRFEHSLGVAALAQRLMHNLVDYHGVALSSDDINDCIVASLCHDVGHGPFSHNFESILLKYTNKDHEDYTGWIITDSELGDILTDLGFNKQYIADIATGRILSQNNVKGALISQLLTSAVNVDSMDYLLRDNYHCGTEGRPVDINRLLLSIDQLEENMLGVDINALISLEGFLLSRISSFRTIYFHKTCRAVQLMLADGIERLVQENDMLNYRHPDDYTAWDDYVLWTEMIHNPSSQPIIQKIQRRELLKCSYESRITISDSALDPQQLQTELADASGIPRENIYIDIPSSPNVPYNHISQTRPNEIFTFRRTDEGKKIPVKLEDYSLFFNHFRGYLKLIRVYTWQKDRSKLSEACEKILGKSRN